MTHLLPLSRAILLAVVAAGSAEAPACAQPMPGSLTFYDVHAHLAGIRGPGADTAGATALAIKTMDMYGIAKAVLMPTPQTQAMGPYDHAALAGQVRRHAGRLAFMGGGGSLNATLHRHADPATVS